MQDINFFAVERVLTLVASMVSNNTHVFACYLKALSYGNLGRNVSRTPDISTRQTVFRHLTYTVKTDRLK